jgi:hypothetical protein
MPIENREFIRQTCADLRNDLDLLFETFVFTYDMSEEELWDGAAVHVINEIPKNEYDEQYEPFYVGSICRRRKREEIERLKHDILIVGNECIRVYRTGFWRLLVWKTWNYHKSKFFDIRTFYLKDYEIYKYGEEPVGDWNGEPACYYNIGLAIDESFTIMEREKAQEFLNILKEYDWFWYI